VAVTDRAGAIEVNTALLILFSTLEQNGIDRVREYDLHCIARDLAKRWWPDLRFIDTPTVYSPGLHTRLHELERGGSLEQLILVHDGWSPRHEYTLTRIGKIRAKDVIEKLETFRASTLRELRTDILSCIGKLTSEERKEDRGYPSEHSKDQG